MTVGDRIRRMREGWTTSLPEDNNLYDTHYDALNAIDNALGGTGIRRSAKRMKYGIKIIGKTSKLQ